MITERQSFNYRGKVLIEKAIVTPPFKHEAAFQNEGCFLYMKGHSAQLLSSDSNIQIEDREAVLMNCGNYYFDIIKESDEHQVELIAIHLYSDALEKIYFHELPDLIHKGTQEIGVKHIVKDSVMARFIDSLEFYFENPSLVNDDLLELKIKELILLLIQTKSADSILQLINDLHTPRQVNIKKVIELHQYSNLSLEQLAKLCNLSLSSFKRDFKKIFNDSPASYINAKKISRAKELLTLTSLTVGEIAYKCGFNDPLYFTRLFKKRQGSSPSSFRTQKTS